MHCFVAVAQMSRCQGFQALCLVVLVCDNEIDDDCQIS